MKILPGSIGLLSLCLFFGACASSVDAPSSPNQDETNSPPAAIDADAVSSTAEQLVSEDFEDGAWDDSFDGATNVENVSVSDAFAHSGQNSSRMFGGYLGAAFDFNIDAQEGEVYYLRYYAYYPSDQWVWTDVSVSGMKNFRAMPPDGWPLFMIKKMDDNQFHTHSYFSPIDLAQLEEFPDLIPAIPTYQHLGDWPAYDTWHLYEIVVSWSQTEGGFAWYLDGELISGVDLENFTYKTWPTAWGYVNNLRICGGNGYPDEDSYYVDDIEIWKGSLSDFQAP